MLSESDNSDKDKPASDASLASVFKSAYEVFNENNGCAQPDQGENPKPSTDLCGIAQDSSCIQSNNNININNNGNNGNANVGTDQSDSNCDETLSTTDLTVLNYTAPIKLSSKYPYTPQKSDASDASDASDELHKIIHKSQDRRSKAEQAGKPELPCIYCGFSDCIEFDLSLHYIEA